MRFDNKTNPQRAKQLKIGELSGVTVPAHEGANVTMIKLAPDGEALLKSAYTEALSEIKVERTIRDQLDPMWEYQHALREAAEKIIQDPTVTDKPTAMREAVLGYIGSVMSLFNQQQPEATTMADNTTELQAERDLYKALSEMTDAQKAHYQQLQESDRADFLKLDAASRNLLVDCAKTADEQHTMLDGTVIAKSATGALFATLKSQDLELRKMREDSLMQKAAAQVAAEIPDIPGEPMAKAKMLMGIQSLDTGAREMLNTTLKAANDLWKARKTPAGELTTEDTDVAKAASGKLMKMVSDYQTAHGVSKSVAMQKVVNTTEGAELYQQSQKGE